MKKSKKINHVKINYEFDPIEECIYNMGGTLLILEKLEDGSFFLVPLKKEECSAANKKEEKKLQK